MKRRATHTPATGTIILSRHGWSAAGDEGVHGGRAQVARLVNRWLGEALGSWAHLNRLRMEHGNALVVGRPPG